MGYGFQAARMYAERDGAGVIEIQSCREGSGHDFVDHYVRRTFVAGTPRLVWPLRVDDAIALVVDESAPDPVTIADNDLFLKT
jgi:hypothetical protein